MLKEFLFIKEKKETVNILRTDLYLLALLPFLLLNLIIILYASKSYAYMRYII